MKRFALTLFCLLGIVTSLTAAEKLKALYLTGHTDRHHSWQVLSQYQITLLEETGIFHVDKVVLPDTVTTESVDFDRYDVVVLNVNQMRWSKKFKKKFARYIRKGGGLVVVHETDNAFPEWKEFNLMTALGGWGDRTEQAGPYCYWCDGALYKDHITPGSAGKHGKRVPFVINVRNESHPIVSGLPRQWLHIEDELYGDLRGPAEHIDVIATAFSETKSGGTGKEEPVLFTVTYGKGRIFRCVLAHAKKGNDKALRNVGYQIVFQRGTQWAATGRVTLGTGGFILSADKPTLRTIDEIKGAARP